jgi:SAM-dependent methyltransferase
MNPSPHDVRWDEAEVARLWSYYATNPAIQAMHFSRVAGAKIREVVRPWIDLDRGSVLDYGCGPGYMIDHLLARSEGKVFGLEFGADAAALANRRLGGQPAFGRVEHVPSLPSAFAPASVDAVTCIEVLEHLNDEHLTGALAEIRRLLKPGGRLLVTTPNEENLESGKTICPHCASVFHRWQHVRSWSAPLLAATLERAGFRVIVCRGALFEEIPKTWYDRTKTVVRRWLGLKDEPYEPHLFAVAEKP